MLGQGAHRAAEESANTLRVQEGQLPSEQGGLRAAQEVMFLDVVDPHIGINGAPWFRVNSTTAAGEDLAEVKLYADVQGLLAHFLGHIRVQYCTKQPLEAVICFL